MTEKIIEELKNRRESLERLDLEMQNRNKDYSRNLWMNIIILSSAIIIGVLPLISENSNIINSLASLRTTAVSPIRNNFSPSTSD